MALSCYNYSVINYNVIKKGRPMAQRDYSLDEKIVTAARDEFSEKDITAHLCGRLPKKRA